MEWLSEQSSILYTATHVELLWFFCTLPGQIFVLVLLGMRIQYRVSGVDLMGSERMARTNNIVIAVLFALIFTSMFTLGLLAVFTRPTPLVSLISIMLLIAMALLLNILIVYYVLSTLRLRAQVNREDESEGGYVHSQEHAEAHAHVQAQHVHEHDALPQSGMKGKHKE